MGESWVIIKLSYFIRISKEVMWDMEWVYHEPSTLLYSILICGAIADSAIANNIIITANLQSIHTDAKLLVLVRFDVIVTWSSKWWALVFYSSQSSLTFLSFIRYLLRPIQEGLISLLNNRLYMFFEYPLWEIVSIMVWKSLYHQKSKLLLPTFDWFCRFLGVLCLNDS